RRGTGGRLRRRGGTRRLAARTAGGRRGRRDTSVRRGHHGERGTGVDGHRGTPGGVAPPRLAAGPRRPLAPGPLDGGGRGPAAPPRPPGVPHHGPPGPRALLPPDGTTLRRPLRGTPRPADAAAHGGPAGPRPLHRP